MFSSTFSGATACNVIETITLIIINKPIRQISFAEYGIIDANGVTLLDFVYDKILYFNNGYAPIKRNNKWGIINTECKFILPMEYDRIRAIYNSRFIVQKGNSIFELDSDGDIKTDITN